MQSQKRPKFTIVISAYNIEDYISDCIYSLKAQNFTDFECIVVDDGSTDETYSRAQKSIADDERFILTTISHNGPQAAKAKGLSIARGEYVIFPDGDDTFHTDCLKRCAENANGCDLLIFGINYQEFSDDTLISEHKSELKEMEFKSGEELADWYIINHKLLLYSNANKCYKLNVIKNHNIGFGNGLSFGEDRLFNYDYITVAGRIKTISDALYNYRKINQKSITSQFRSHHIDELLFLHNDKMDYMFGLSKSASEEEKEKFRKYDLDKTVCLAFKHIGEHFDELPCDIRDEEISYLSSFVMPEAFYEEYEQVSLVDYINQHVFSENVDFDLSDITSVIVLGSQRCEYRVEAAFEKFGNIKYICCGENVSSYKDTDGHFLTEAEYMRSYLKDAGVTDILIENHSKNTYENIKNALQIIDADEKPVVVTAAFHKVRTECMLKTIGLDWMVFPVYGPNTRPDNWYKNKTGINVIIGEFEKNNQYF